MSESCSCKGGGGGGRGGANLAAFAGFTALALAIGGLIYIVTLLVTPPKISNPKNVLSVEVSLEHIAEYYEDKIARELEDCVGDCARSRRCKKHCGHGPYDDDHPEQPVNKQRSCAELQGRRVTVQKGDTLYRIAWCNRVPVSQLARYNDIANPSALIPGQVIHIRPERGFLRTPFSEF